MSLEYRGSAFTEQSSASGVPFSTQLTYHFYAFMASVFSRRKNQHCSRLDEGSYV
jgi:hypothetical protein